MMLVIFVGFSILSVVLVAKSNPECGYKQCPPTRDGSLNVHLIAHSHMDAGCVKTFDEYYYGTNKNISSANVRLIYHSVLSELLHDKRRRFTFSETAYFWRWWREQNFATRSTFRSLVAEGRIHFAGGGWVQADETTVDYLQLLDLYTWGLRKLNDTLGPCGKPRAAWQIDAYGHSKEHASLLAQMGFDGLFIGRVGYNEKEAMIDEDRMEFMWRGSEALGKMCDIMTHTMYNLYSAPEGFCFHHQCTDEPVIDDPDSGAFNADIRVKEFLSQIETQAKYYDHDNVIVTMGGDFTYQSAAGWFMNIDSLISYVNSHRANISDVNIFYSSPSCYLKAIYLHGRRDKLVHSEKGDHLPYGTDNEMFWTGFYTSRPGLKYLAKRAHVFLQVVKQLAALSRMQDSYELHLLRHAASLVLHHDGITGTSSQHVTNDFIRILSEAIDVCSKKISQFLSVLTPTWGARRRPHNLQFTICHQMNLSQCQFTETEETMLVLVYNPLSIKTYYHARLPATALHYSIKDFNDEEVEYQVLPLPATVTSLPGRNSSALHELCFEAENIPPLGYTAYLITPIRDQQYLKVSVDPSTGLLESVQYLDGVKIMVHQNFHYYSQGQHELQSGVYCFRPETGRPTKVSDKVSFHTTKGLLVKEIRQTFNEWVSQIIRLYRGEEFLELEWVIGPVPVNDTDPGKEVVTIFKTNVSNAGIFYTDSNSRQMMKRTCLHEARNRTHKKPVQACYYPVTSRICIQSNSSSVEMCVLTDRAQGGTSYNAGEIELMIHRRLLTDDGLSLDEPLNEQEFGAGVVVRGKHRIFFGNFKQEVVDDQSFSERASQMSRKWTMEPWLLFTPGEKISRRKWRNVRNKRGDYLTTSTHTIIFPSYLQRPPIFINNIPSTAGYRTPSIIAKATDRPPLAFNYKPVILKYSGLLLNGLPRHVHVLTLEPWKGGSVLLRLENLQEKSQVSKSSDDNKAYIAVDIRKIFLHHKVKMVRETTLAANQWLEDARQMDWSSRYVYPGSTDGVLAEENTDYADDVQIEDKESDTYVEDFAKRKTKRKRNMKNVSKFSRMKYNRRNQRSVNIQNDDTKTNNSAVLTYCQDKTEANEVLEDEKYSIFTLLPNNLTVKTSKVSTTITPKPQSTTTRYQNQQNNKTSDDVKKEVKHDYFKDLSAFTSKLKRYKSYEYDSDDLDDDITKSIYDMYYKTKAKKIPFKPYIRNPDEFRYVEKTSSKNIRVVDNDNYPPRRGKYKNRNRRKQRLNSFGTIKPNGENDRGRNDYEDVGEPGQSEDDSLDDVNDEDDVESDGHTLKKRSSKYNQNTDSSESVDQNEDFLFSLRPTQIRTFVVWFEEKTRASLRNQ